MMTLPNASDFIQAFVKRRRFKTWTCQDQGHKSSIEQKQNNMLLNDYKSEVHLKWSQLQRPHHLHKRKTSCQSKELLKCITALWIYFESHFFMQLDTGCSSPVTSARAGFRGFVFISSWIWPPAAARCLSHEASNLLKVRVMRWTQQTLIRIWRDAYQWLSRFCPWLDY